MQKLVSALCITYGRYKLLEEAIESFLRQDYINKELIIVNDLAEQTLIFDHPQVKIYNFKTRFPTIGDKRNESVKLSSGEILLSWDDDDIYLPWMISKLAKEFELDTRLGFVQPNKSWCLNGDKLEYSKGWCAHTAFTKESFNAVGGYASINSGQDMNLINKLKKYLGLIRTKELMFSNEDACYIFRWNNGNYHLSGFGRDRPNRESGFNQIEKSIKSKPIEPLIKLNPHWNKDYLQLTKDFILKSKQ